MPERGLRPTTDSRVLARWIRLREGERIADLGCGIGNIALQLAARKKAELHGFELQPELIQVAQKNAQINEPLLQGDVSFHQWDARNGAPARWRSRFDKVVCNPPWHRQGSGRLSPDPLRAAATHELEGSLADFLCCAHQLLRSGGTAYFILIAERHAEMLSFAKQAELHPASIKNIHTRSLKHPPQWRIYRLVKGRHPSCRQCKPCLAS
jgi:tRNA1(Val) A37 N6-methylase TrmN6